MSQVQTLSNGLSHERRPLAASLHDHARAQAIKCLRRNRRRRSQFFNAGLFSDPAWDMLLELYLAQVEQRRLSIGGLCSAAEVPLTTGLRWIDAFSREDLLRKAADPLDARRVWVSLTPEAATAMNAYFDDLPNLRGI